MRWAIAFVLLCAPMAFAADPDLGIDASLHGKPIFPPDDPWNRDISREPVDPNSTALIASIGANRGLHADFGTTYQGHPNGIPYVIIPGGQATQSIKCEYADQSDPGPYPIPSDAPIEGGATSDGDRHVLVIDRDAWKLYELWHATPLDGGKPWAAGSAAVFDLKSNTTRPAGWTSADAAGLPIFPGLVRFDEVAEAKAINHAIRFTVQRSRKAYVPPARHFASSSTNANLPPMGMRVRLKASFDTSDFPLTDRVILEAMKKYGMIVADNGSNWFVSGAPDPRWNEDELHQLSKVQGSQFEVIKMTGLVTK